MWVEKLLGVFLVGFGVVMMQGWFSVEVDNQWWSYVFIIWGNIILVICRGVDHLGDTIKEQGVIYGRARDRRAND
jgi:hypothetical protein